MLGFYHPAKVHEKSRKETCIIFSLEVNPYKILVVTAIFYPRINFSFPRFPWSKNIISVCLIFIGTRALEKMGRGGQEGSLLVGIWGFHLFSSAARGPPPVPELFSLTCTEVWSSTCSKVDAILLKELELILKPIHPVHKKAFISLCVCRKVCDNTPECEMLEEMTLGHCLT